MIIAMNYAAKDKGVNRLAAGPSVLSEAKKLCPDLVVVATELITKSPSDVDDDDEMAIFMDEEGNMAEVGEAGPTKSMQKVSLKKYRDESVKIFKIILEHVQPKYFEKVRLRTCTFYSLSSIGSRDTIHRDKMVHGSPIYV
jgi:hypothetical protein